MKNITTVILAAGKSTRFISNKSKNKNAGLIASLSETLPKHIRDKCLKSGVVPLQGLKESLYAIHSSILTGQAWSQFNILKNIELQNKTFLCLDNSFFSNVLVPNGLSMYLSTAHASLPQY